jgi:hypothetical protein
MMAQESQGEGGSGKLNGMRFMNDYDIQVARERWRHHPVLGPATATLEDLYVAVQAGSDGWAYWPQPVRAASRLMELIEGDGTDKYLRGERKDATPAKLKAALVPVKSFRTRSGLAFDITEYGGVVSEVSNDMEAITPGL